VGQVASTTLIAFPFGAYQRHAGIVRGACRDLVAFCCAALSVRQPGKPRDRASVAGGLGLDSVPVSVPNQIPWCGPPGRAAGPRCHHRSRQPNRGLCWVWRSPRPAQLPGSGRPLPSSRCPS